MARRIARFDNHSVLGQCRDRTATTTVVAGSVIAGQVMQTKFSVAVEGKRRSVLSDRPSINVNGSHVVIDVAGDGDDLYSMLLDRDCVLRILQDGYNAGMFDQYLANHLPRKTGS